MKRYTKADMEKFRHESGARTNADGFYDTAEQIEEDLEEMNAREDECGV